MWGKDAKPPSGPLTRPSLDSATVASNLTTTLADIDDVATMTVLRSIQRDAALTFYCARALVGVMATCSLQLIHATTFTIAAEKIHFFTANMMLDSVHRALFEQAILAISSI